MLVSTFGGNPSAASMCVQYCRRLVGYEKQLLQLKEQKKDTSVLVKIVAAAAAIKEYSVHYTVIDYGLNMRKLENTLNMLELEAEEKELQQSEAEIKNKLSLIK